MGIRIVGIAGCCNGTADAESPTNCKKGSKIAAAILPREFIAQWDYQIFNSHVSLSVARAKKNLCEMFCPCFMKVDKFLKSYVTCIYLLIHTNFI